MTGQVAFAKRYFQRVKDQNRIWRRLDRGCHLLVLAPRRVGKTSTLRYLEHNPEQNYVFHYSIVQSCSNSHEFFSTLIENLNDSVFIDRLKKLENWKDQKLNSMRHCIKGIKFSEAGIEFQNKNKVLSHNDLKSLLKTIDIKEKLVLVIDEFPDVVEKIHKHHGHAATEQFLSMCRELMQDPELDSKIQYIFTGSIGLDSLVNKLSLTNLINALTTVNITPMTDEESLDFLQFVADAGNVEMDVGVEVRKCILNTIDWNIPYYLEQLWISLEDLCAEEEITSPTIKHVDKAFEQLFSQNYLENFNHWAERLRRLEPDERKLAHEILSYLATNPILSSMTFHNLKEDEKFNEVNSVFVIKNLIHDGYIYQNENQDYQFTSPMLKKWWCHYATR